MNITPKLTIVDIERVKEEGNNAFKNENFYKAIMLYEEGIRRCKEFAIIYEGQMPFKQ